MTVDLLFTTHNRLEFTRASLAALVGNTDWSRISRLHVADDHSTDGTADLVAEACEVVPVEVVWHDQHRGPVQAMNAASDQLSHGCKVLAKVDNDVVVCPGWLEAMLRVLRAAKGLHALGMEPGFGDPVAPLDARRTWRAAPWIGGVGLIRTRVFARHRPRPTGQFFGWTEFQRHHVKAGWVTPDLPVFLLDHLPFEPWRSLAASYVEAGWQREWPVYPDEMAGYWSWWQPAEVAA